MSPDLVKALRQQYPKVYKNLHEVDCGDGWFELIAELSSYLEPRITHSGQMAIQVKHKFGGLRFYMSQTTQEMNSAIMAAEKYSYRVCETCGTSPSCERHVRG